MRPLKQWTPLASFLALLLTAATLMAQNAPANAVAPPANQPGGAAMAASAGPVQPPSAAESNPGDAGASQQHVAPLALKAATVLPPAGGAPAAQDSQGAAGTTTLHLVVGRSLFVSLPEKLRRVYVSNPVVLDAMTSSAQEVVITAKSAGVSSLVLWTAAGQTKLFTVLADVDVSGLRDSLAQALPGDQVEVQAQQGRIHLSGIVDSDAAADEASRLANVYSKDVVNSLVVDARHLPQIQLQVRIAEVDRSKLDAFGINFFSLGKNSGASTTGQFSPPSFQTQNGTNSAVVSDFLNLFYFNFDHAIGVTIKDLQTKGILEILAEPNLTTLHGKPARFLAGGEFPYPIVQPGGAGSVPTVTVQFRPYGVKLEFTPFVNSDGSIRLKVAPEVSALDYTNQVVIAGYALPALSTRRAETEVELKDGQSFGISGILDHRTTDSLSKIPGIGDIPVLGQLFRSKNLNRSTMELVVIVTPRIVDTLHDAQLPAATAPAEPVPPLRNQAFDHDLPKN
ncbi:MAG TPA: type II and III secretion system protein family protein [Chloroflexota bacterium]|nr:type II and III secretion system protein family protein [Chloroflexota bacterium]